MVKVTGKSNDKRNIRGFNCNSNFRIMLNSIGYYIIFIMYKKISKGIGSKHCFNNIRKLM